MKAFAVISSVLLLQACAGVITHAGLAQDVGRDHLPPEQALARLVSV